MKKIDINLKLKYLKWLASALFQEDTIVVSGFFANEEIEKCEKFKEEIISDIYKKIYKLEKCQSGKEN